MAFLSKRKYLGVDISQEYIQIAKTIFKKFHENPYTTPIVYLQSGKSSYRGSDNRYGEMGKAIYYLLTVYVHENSCRFRRSALGCVP
jgi:DNA modification methylase